MQNNGINFTSYEQCIMKDTDFLLAKREITVKITGIFEELAKILSSEQVYESLSEKLNIQFQGAKISKGENYRGLPYIVLDHPRFFDKNNIFTFRTMFWWGNSYSFTLHVQGKFLEAIKKDSFKKLKDFSKTIYISAGNSPWEYHYEEENYILLNRENAEKLFNESLAKGFIKHSRRMEIDTPPEKIVEEGLVSFQELVLKLMF